jgi:hypothetical protein
MSAQHTPGPWHADGRLAGDGAYTQIIGQDGTPVAEVILWSNIDYEEGGDSEWEELAANARLIAAAPEMLQALRRAVLALAFASQTSPAMLDDYNAVSAAITKATGGAS